MSLVMTDRQTSIQDFNETASSPNEDDEGINNEHEIGNEEEITNVYNAQNDEEDNDEEDDEPDNLTPDSPAPNPPVLQKVIHRTNFDFHSLLEDDISDVFNYTSETGQPGVSYKRDLTDPSVIVVTFNFHTNFIETETACQWQICNKRPLTCQLSIDCAHYLNEKVNVLHVCQICDCHPANKSKVPFIERLARDFVEKAPRNMETLKLTRAALKPELRLKYFLETLTDEFKRKQYTEMLSETQDETLLNEVLDNEILDSREKTAAKLSLLKPPRQKSSDKIIHYDLKQLPTLHHGYLVQFYKYMEYRLKNLNSLCVMCGKRTFESNDKKASKPAICDDYECFSNAMDSKFRNDPLPPSIFSIEIADFLLLLVDAAIKSPRHELILDPYPRLINPYNTSTTLLDETGNKEENLKMLEEIMNRLREMGSITQYEVARISLRGMIELKHLWAFPFFHWLMGTNRYHFSFIPREHHIKSVSTNFQYFIKHEDIVKHVKFKQMRAEKGSIFAFHGSPQENWHAILRSGLQIGRGGYLINGAAYGAGIYVSPSFEFSAGYTRNYRSHNYGASEYIPDENDKKSPLDNRKWSCIALCEIINSSDVYKKHTNDIWTIQDPDYICTRFIFFFPRGVSHNYYRVDSENEADLIRKLIHTLNNIAL